MSWLNVPMAVVELQAWTEANIDSNIPENDAPAWVPGTTYPANALVIRSHSVWISLQAGNAGRDPLDALQYLWWTRVGPTNRWAALDKATGTATAQAGGAVWTFSGLADTVGLLDLADVYSATLVQTRYGLELSRSTVDLLREPVNNWYDWMAAPIRPRRAALFTNLPRAADSTFALTLVGGPNCRCGTLAAGIATAIGFLDNDFEIGGIDYSVDETSKYAVTTLAKGQFRRKLNLRTLIEQGDVDRLSALMVRLSGTNALWIGVGSLLDSLLIYGYCREHSIKRSSMSFQVFELAYSAGN